MGFFDRARDAASDAASSARSAASNAASTVSNNISSPGSRGARDSATGKSSDSSSDSSSSSRSRGGPSSSSSSVGSPVDGSPNSGDAPTQVGGASGRSTSGGGGSSGGSSSSSGGGESRRERVTERVRNIGGGAADRVDAIADTGREITTSTVEGSVDVVSNIGTDSGSDPSGSPATTDTDFAGQSTREGIGTETVFEENITPSDPVERFEAGLNDASQTIRPTLRGTGNLAGQAVATASLAPAVEEAAFGTRRSEDAIVGAGEEAALALDLPGAASAGVSGVDFVFRGPDNTELNRREAASAAVSDGVDQFTSAAQESPVETTGRAAGALLGGFGVGTAAARGGRRLAGGLGSADDVAGGASIGTQSNPGGLGSRGSGTLFDVDDVTAANRQSRSGSSSTTSTDTATTQPASSGSSASRSSLDEIAAGVESGRIGESRAAVRDLNDRIEDMDFFGDQRAQAQIGRQRQQPRSQTPGLNDDRVTANLYQQSVDDQLRRQRRATDDSTFDGGGTPFSDNTLRAQREADAEAIARRERQNPGALFDEGDDLSGFGFGSVEGVGLGAGGAGAGFLGSLNLSGQETPTTGQTLFEIGGTGVGGDEDTGIASDTDAGGDTGLDVGPGAFGDTTSDTTAAQAFTLRESVRTGSRPSQSPMTAQPVGDSTLAQPTGASEGFGQATTGTGGFGGGTRGVTRRPRFDIGEGDRDDDIERAVFGTEDDLFDSGILSGAEAAGNLGFASGGNSR